jgi:hypothetical protein
MKQATSSKSLSKPPRQKFFLINSFRKAAFRRHDAIYATIRERNLPHVLKNHRGCRQRGVGKTTVSAAIVRILTEQYPNLRILAIDADPAIGLSTRSALTSPRRWTTSAKRSSRKTVSGETREAIDLLNEARFHVFEAWRKIIGLRFSPSAGRRPPAAIAE